jgi:predicted HTH domain antitoxin
MNVALPEQVEARLSPEEVRLDLAVGMYSSGRVTMGIAAEVAGLSIPEF